MKCTFPIAWPHPLHCMAEEVARFDGEPRCELHVPECQVCREMATHRAGPVNFCSVHAVGNGAQAIEVELDLSDTKVLTIAVETIAEARRK